MAIIDIIRSYADFPFDAFCAGVTDERIETVLASQRPRLEDLLVLLSPRALAYLEPMARRAAALTRSHFGNVIFLFTPLYLSNYCDNGCPYCSFSRGRTIPRKQLAPEEIRQEAERISASGIRHILVLTGESRSSATIDYLCTAVGILADYFSSIGIEIYPLHEDEYASLIDAGVDALTIYQETYDSQAYRLLHGGGPKEDYRFRLEAPDRACRRRIRSVTVGALLGLHDLVKEVFFTALHARYLQQTYPDVEISLSFPRLRPLAGDFTPPVRVSQRQLVQIICAFRIFFPTAGITLSTRESEGFRNGVVPLGVTRISAGVSTAVGGHSDCSAPTQFEIADTRSVRAVRDELRALGFQPVMHDWHRRLGRAVTAW